ncbi:hypothetical protein [Clostridium thermobutyricum]|uniref:hypothetical protein n=1 Tax=Clostridium thermobutyricum TaxID=29372 RepID=UPI0018ABF1AE|nr:hypothetical protein [Clostridium thermobutyricum]
MTKDEIYEELFKNTKDFGIKKIILESKNFLGKINDNKFEEVVDAIGSFDIKGFRIDNIDKNMFITFIKDGKYLEVFKLRVNENKESEILDFKDNSQKSIEDAIKVSVDSKYRYFYLTEIFQYDIFIVRAVYNLNIKSCSSEEAMKWATNIKSNSQMLFVKEHKAIMPSAENFFTLKGLSYAYIKDSSKPFSELNALNVDSNDFINSLDSHSDGDIPFVSCTIGIFEL